MVIDTIELVIVVACAIALAVWLDKKFTKL